MARRGHYASAVTQIGDKLMEAKELLSAATEAMVEERPGDAKTVLEQAEMVIHGAAILAKWAMLMKEAR